MQSAITTDFKKQTAITIEFKTQRAIINKFNIKLVKYKLWQNSINIGITIKCSLKNSPFITVLNIAE